MTFRNREEAARQLADALKQYRGMKPLVLGVPRGGVPMARALAAELDGDCDVILVHKLRAPMQPELAIGAIDEHGRVFLAQEGWEVGASPEYLAHEKQIQLEDLRRRREIYTPVHHPISPRDREVIVVDDGSATGATLIAALRAVRAQFPARLIGAAAVAPLDTAARIRHEADEFVCLHTPEQFTAVGEFFEDFSPVSDEEVVMALQTAA